MNCTSNKSKMKPLSCGHIYENGSGRRKRCPACAREHYLEQMRARSREHYEPKKPRPSVTA